MVSDAIKTKKTLVSKFESSLSPCWSSGHYSQKVIEGFDCWINVITLGASLWHSFVELDWQAQTQGVCRLLCSAPAAFATGSYHFAIGRSTTALAVWGLCIGNVSQ